MHQCWGVFIWKIVLGYQLHVFSLNLHLSHGTGFQFVRQKIHHSQNWFSRWGRRFYFKVAAERFPSWDTIRDGNSFRIRLLSSFLLDQEVYHLLNKKPPLLLSTVMEFTFQVRSKLLTFSPRKLSTSLFILNFSECSEILYRQSIRPTKKILSFPVTRPTHEKSPTQKFFWGFFDNFRSIFPNLHKKFFCKKKIFFLPTDPRNFHKVTGNDNIFC